MTRYAGREEPNGYTSGEGVALIAPLCGADVDAVKGYVVVAVDADGNAFATGTNLSRSVEKARVLAEALAAELATIASGGLA